MSLSRGVEKRDWGLGGAGGRGPGGDLLSRTGVHYHRRGFVSRSCSGWEGVGPKGYGRQA